MNLLPEDYYMNKEGNLVFTELYHLKRGYCCKNGCLHCPYGFMKDKKDQGLPDKEKDQRK